MNLKDYLAGKGKEAKTEDWLEFCTLDVKSGSLWAGDPHIANSEDGCVVEVPPGKYVVEGIGMPLMGGRVVSRLRVRLQSEDHPELGEEVGEAGTDSALIGVCDIEAFDEACGKDAGDEVQEAIESQTGDGYGIIKLEKFPGAVMAFVPTGSDGGGPVFELLSASGKCVGMELPFTDDEEDEEEEDEDV